MKKGKPTEKTEKKESASELFSKEILESMDSAYEELLTTDVADQVPIDFWEEARGELDLLNRDLVIVAEGTNPVNTRYAFDANYSWKTTNIMKDVIHGVQPVIEAGGAKCIRYSHETYMKSCPKRTLLWNMTENHDTSTDSFDDRDEKVYGPAACELSIAYCFAIDGVPLLFCGQEIAFDRRVSMFGNKAGWIDWDVDGKTEKALDRSAKIRKWVGMRRTYSSLSHGETTWIDNDQPQTVCSFIRHDGKSQDVLFVGNFSADKIKVKLADGKKYSLDPWGYVFEPMN